MLLTTLITIWEGKKHDCLLDPPLKNKLKEALRSLHATELRGKHEMINATTSPFLLLLPFPYPAPQTQRGHSKLLQIIEFWTWEGGTPDELVAKTMKFRF